MLYNSKEEWKKKLHKHAAMSDAGFLFIATQIENRTYVTCNGADYLSALEEVYHEMRAAGHPKKLPDDPTKEADDSTSEAPTA